MRRIIPTSLFLALLVLTTPAVAAEYTIGEGSQVTYFASHPLHDVEGISTQAEGTIQYDPAYPLEVTGLAETAIKIAWETFDSGNQNRDANIMDTVGAQRYPNLIFVIETLDLEADAEDENLLTGTVTGRLYANGVRRDIQAPLTMDISDPDTLAVSTSFSVNMTDFKMKPPRLLFVAAREDVDIEARFRLVSSSKSQESLAAE